LADLVLLIERGALDPDGVRAAVAATFAARGTHPVPTSLPAPPPDWAADFSDMAREADLSTADCREAFTDLERYWLDNDLGVGGTG
jgi:hypothetical protein